MDPSMLPVVPVANEMKDATGNLIVRLLGPSLDVWGEYFGERSRGFVNKRQENVQQVLEAADHKLPNELPPGASIHPRVLKDVFEVGSFVEDQLVADYFGGVLASSMTGVSRDDRGASMAKLVAELSAYKVRLHFVIYREIKRLFDGSSRSLDISNDCDKMRVFLPIEPLVSSLDISQEELGAGIIGASVTGLRLPYKTVARRLMDEPVLWHNHSFPTISGPSSNRCFPPSHPSPRVVDLVSRTGLR